MYCNLLYCILKSAQIAILCGQNNTKSDMLDPYNKIFMT